METVCLKSLIVSYALNLDAVADSISLFSMLGTASSCARII